MQRSPVALTKFRRRVIRFKDEFRPHFQKIQEGFKKERHRQVPFLEVSRETSLWKKGTDKPHRLVKIDLAQIMGIKVGDRVRILYGREKGSEGIVGKILREDNQVIVRGANLRRSFWHPEPGPGKPSIMSVECPVHVTNVVLLDPVTKTPTRVKRRYMMNGECVRVSKVSGCAMPDPIEVGPNEREILYEKHKEQNAAVAKERRGTMKEDVFGNKKYFQMLVGIMRDRQTRQAEEQKAE
eukprot:TRINITY_DN61505_c0_g1_i1.p1 TRINITY_DN61505_c0_g1~~TRINITY_DN61505_c0_g1_i1.p1  ORF type:complete len:239 (+),score=62.71 TRINITY_DN61505_c0_g1_i1:187-903(+)